MSSESQRATERSRTLIVHRDETGYGLTLSGDKPCRVQTVKPGGASDKAGVREGDVIIKVNGQQVTESLHGEVVKLIQTGSYVALTVVHSSRFAGLQPGDSVMVERSESSRRESITGPSPANNEAERRFYSDKVHTVQLMIEQQTRVVEELRSSLARSNSKKVKVKLDSAIKHLEELEAKQSVNIKHSPDKLTPVAPPRTESMGLGLALVSGLPPPLPVRNPKSEASEAAPAPPPRNISTASLPPPPPSKFPRPNSVENLHSRPNELQLRRNSQVSPPSPRPSVEHQRTRSSPLPIEATLEIAKALFGGEKSGQKSPRYETPPGTPPPPYRPETVWGTVGTVATPNIITMEDDSDDNLEEDAGQGPGQDVMFSLPPEGDHGPFNTLTELLQHPAHLAVFLNYVISNSDPNPLLFFLITDAYKSGSAKEMRKWAYEIHSCFLVPSSPLELPNLEDGILSIGAGIDKFLSDESSDQLREESLLKLFWKARSRARDVLKVQLDDFRAKRAAGLGSIFGPPDPELKQCDENLEKKMAVINELLVPVLETMAEDLENATDRNSTLCAALATVLHKIFNTKDQKAQSIIDKIPTFVSKEKKKIFGRVLKKNLNINGHNFELKHYDQLTYCNQSQGIIWGIGPQGYRCANCGFDVHKKFVHKVEETCVGPSNKKGGKKRGDRAERLSTILPIPIGLAGRLSDVGRIMSRDQLQIIETSGHRKASVSPSPSMRLGGQTDLNLTPSEDQTDTSRLSLEPGEMRGGQVTCLDSHVVDSLNSGELGATACSPKVGKDLKRSESAKDGENVRRTRPRKDVRKHSDPYQRTGRHSLDGDNAVSGSSSNSSISALWEPLAAVRPDLLRQDSDLESEAADPPDWRTRLTADQLASLSAREAKRQDVINELFHTERSHVRNMKVLDKLFRRPLLESGLMPREVVERLFPNIDDVISVHSSYNNAMRNLMEGGFPIMEIGETLSDMFLGSYGEKLISVGAEFTKNQKFTLEELKRMRQRDSKVEQKLSELESNPACRRLQLQSMLAWEHHRLVKYPLLLQQIMKYTAEDNPEMDVIKEVLGRTKEILNNIDKEVAEAQNKRNLEELQRNLDTSGLEKMGPDNPVFMEYRNVDLTKLRLIHDGQLTLNLGGENRRLKNIELYVLLLEDCVMFLQKQDEKYLLKFHTGSNSIVPGGTKDEVKKILSPVIKFSTMLVRPVATNKRAFYLMNTTQIGAQLYELQASSSNERSTWLSHIQEATNAYKSRENRHRTTHHGSNISFVHNIQQKFENNMDLTDRRAPSTLRSQSFNEQSLRQRELLARPLPSPPVEKEVETLERKIEKLSRKDEEVAKALEEKQKIIADIFNIPPEDYDTITDLVVGTEDRKDAKDVLLAVMAQADSLARCVNECLKVSDPEEAVVPVEREMRLATPPSDKLVTITTNMNTNLTALLAILQDQEDEKMRWRRELMASQEQVRAFVTGNSDSHSFRSRPDSFISLESDIASEQENDKSEIVEIEQDSSATAPSSSTPLKDSTPTNQDVSDNRDNTIDEERIEVEVGESANNVVLIGEMIEVKDIVESSDC